MINRQTRNSRGLLWARRYLCHPTRAFFALVGAILLLTPSIALAKVDIKRWQTEHDTAVYFIASTHLPIVDLTITVPAGSGYVPANKMGLAALTATLLKLGVDQLDENGFANALADLGAAISVTTDNDFMTISLRSLTEGPTLDAALQLLQRMLSSATFDAAIFQREQQNLIARLQDQLTRPDTIARRQFFSTIYRDHPYGQLTTAASVQAIGIDDVKAFYKKHFSAKSATITLVGDVDQTRAQTIAHDLAKHLPDGAAIARLPAVPDQVGKDVLVPHEASQAHVLLGMPFLKRGEDDFFALQIAVQILGGGFGSRLTKEIREKKGYAYSVYSYFSTRRNRGPLVIGLQTEKVNTREVLTDIDRILTTFINEGVRAEELDRAKQYLIGSFAINLDSNKKISRLLQIIGSNRLPLNYLDYYLQRMRAVTRDEVLATFKKRFNRKNLSTIVVGYVPPDNAEGG